MCLPVKQVCECLKSSSLHICYETWPWLGDATINYKRASKGQPFFRSSSCHIKVVWEISVSNSRSSSLLSYFQVYSSKMITYLPTPWSRVLLEKLTGFAANQEIPCILWNLKVHYHTYKRCHLSLSWANSIQSPQPLPTSFSYTLILSSHLRLGLPNGLFPSRYPTKTLCTPLPSSLCATCPAHLILLDFITRTWLGEEYRTLSSSLCNFLHSSVTPSGT